VLIVRVDVEENGVEERSWFCGIRAAGEDGGSGSAFDSDGGVQSDR
jgi:hypothetical protein